MSGPGGSEFVVPAQVSRTLHRATALLPCRVRAEVQAELLGNLWQMRLDGELRGLEEKQAWDAALAQLGPLWSLALRLAWVHGRSQLRRWLLVGAALGGAAYAVQNQVPHPVPALEARP